MANKKIGKGGSLTRTKEVKKQKQGVETRAARVSPNGAVHKKGIDSGIKTTGIKVGRGKRKKNTTMVHNRGYDCNTLIPSNNRGELCKQ